MRSDEEALADGLLMPSLLNIIDNVPTGSKGQQSKLEAFFGAKGRESETQEQGAGSESGAKLMNYLQMKKQNSKKLSVGCKKASPCSMFWAKLTLQEEPSM